MTATCVLGRAAGQVCGDEVANGKPAPDTFLAAARLLGVPPGEEGACLVVEDALAGVEVHAPAPALLSQ